MNSARDFLDYHRLLLNQQDDQAFVRAHGIFLQELAGLPHGFLDAIPRPERPALSSFFIDSHLRWLALQEKRGDFQSGDPIALALEIFGPGALQRMAPLEKATARGCRHLVMVGCGPLPLTVLWMAKKFPQMDFTAMDTDEGALLHARQVAGRFDVNPIQFLLMNGRNFDFSNADLVCVANQVRTKKTVLERIALTGGAATVVVRVPYGNGWLIAEPAEEVPASFSILGQGGECPKFLSRNLCLEIRGKAEGRM